MDDEVLALLNSKVYENADSGTSGMENQKTEPVDADECRSISIVGKSETSSSFGGSEDLSSSVVDDDSADEYSKTCIRVGDSFQVFIPDKLLTQKVKEDPREGVLIWRPSGILTDEELTDYIRFACDTHHFTVEQALGLLLWHNHSIRLARDDLANFEASAETWNSDETALFEEAYKLHNKRFHLYSELLPHKTMASLVDYYYSRYKRRSASFAPMNLRSSHVGAFSSQPAPAPSQKEQVAAISTDKKQNGAGLGAVVDREVSKPKSQPVVSLDPRINVLPSLINPTNPQQPVSSTNGKRLPFARPPRGLYLRLEELATLASVAASSKNSNPPTDPIDSSRAELATSLNKLQQQRLRCQEYKRQLGSGIRDFCQVPVASKSINQPSTTTSEPQWTKHETSLAVAAFRQYGANFSLIADFVGTKAETHVRYFYQTYRNRYNLDALLAEYEAEKRSLSLFPTPEDDFLMRRMANRAVTNGVSASNGIGLRPDSSPAATNTTTS